MSGIRSATWVVLVLVVVATCGPGPSPTLGPDPLPCRGEAGHMYTRSEARLAGLACEGGAS